MDKLECSGRCYECSGCDDLELQIYTEIMFKALGINCETTQEKMKRCLDESERLGRLIKDKTIDELLRARYRANRITCNVQFSIMVGAFNAIEWKINKYKEKIDSGAEPK